MKLAALLLVPLPLLFGNCLGARAAETVHNFGRWEPEITSFERRDRTNPPPQNGVLFIGSSTIRLWKSLATDFPQHRVVNRGFGGSEIVDSTHFADRLIFPWHPRVVFLRAGGNDIFAGKSPEQVFEDFKGFVRVVRDRLPETQVVFISLSPSIARWHQAEKEKALNQMVETYARDTAGVKYLESYDLSLGPDGKPRPELFLTDKLHFNAAGYKLLAERVRLVMPPTWEPVGFSGGGAMFTPAISPADPDLMLLNCDMGAAYLSDDGGHHWRMLNHAQLRSDTRCRPAFHPTDRDVIYASSGGQLKVSRDRGRTFLRLGNLRESLDGEIAINPATPDVMLAGSQNGRCWVSRDAGGTWTVCAGPVGRVLGFYFPRTGDGTTVLAATEKGIWRSDDSGTNWTERTEGLPWKELQGFTGGTDAGGAVMLYCTVRSKDADGEFKGGVYRSRDRGQTWELAMGAGLNRETKKADAWAYGAISQYHQILTTDARPLTVYAMNTATGFHPPHFDTVYRSDDGGGTWRPVYFMDPRFKEYNVAPDYVTASAGQSFKGGDTPFGAAICNSDPERLLLVRNECHITHNGGQNWFCGSTSPAQGQTFGPGTAWACSGLVVTTTWHYYIDPFETNRHYIAYTDIGWARSLDAGKSWIWWSPKTWAPWRNTCYEIAFDPQTPGKMWGAFSDVHDIPNDNIISERHGHNRPGGVCLSLDFGASWSAVATGLPTKAVTSVVVDPKSQAGMRTLYAGVFEGGVFKSVDDGKTWVAKNQGLGHPANLRVSRLVLHEDGTLFAMVCAKRPGPGKPLAREGTGLYCSHEGAATWERLNLSQPWLYPKDFSVAPHNSRRILVGTCDTGGADKSGGLYFTGDAGETWQRIGRQGPQTFGGYFHPQKPTWIYMTLTEGAPGAGLWLSRDDGKTWTAFEDLPFSNIQRVEFDPEDAERLRVTTFGGSVWRGPAAP